MIGWTFDSSKMGEIMARLEITRGDLYTSLKAHVDNARKYHYSGRGARIGHNTYAQYEKDSAAGAIEVTFHNTVIAVVWPSDSVMVNARGWHTVTTKDRLNQLVPYPYSICQDHYQWYVYDHLTHKRVPFEDGMILPGQ